MNIFFCNNFICTSLLFTLIAFLYFAFPFISGWAQDIVHGNFSKVCPQGKRVLTATAGARKSPYLMATSNIPLGLSSLWLLMAK